MVLMKKLTLTILAAILLSGCGYDHSEIQAAKAACATHGGQFSLTTNGIQSVIGTSCKVDGVTYRIGRTKHELLEGRVE